MKHIICLLCCLLTSCSLLRNNNTGQTASIDSVSDPVKTSLTTLISSLPSNSILAFTGLRGLDGSKTELANLASHRMEPVLAAICKEKGIKLIERENINLILNEWKLDMSGITGADKGARALLGADIILTGKISADSCKVHTTLKAVTLEKGEIIAAQDFLQPVELFETSALAAGKTAVSDKARNISQSEDGTIKLWSERETYQIGEKITLFFEVNKPVYVALVDITPDGNKMVIFPNSYIENNFCEPGKTYSIPPAGAPYAFEVGGPTGTDRIMAFSSSKPGVAPTLMDSQGLDFTKNLMNTSPSRANIAITIR